jgi:hypothetical protein
MEQKKNSKTQNSNCFDLLAQMDGAIAQNLNFRVLKNFI